LEGFEFAGVGAVEGEEVEEVVCYDLAVGGVSWDVSRGGIER
jgi:hypothetical protein